MEHPDSQRILDLFDAGERAVREGRVADLVTASRAAARDLSRPEPRLGLRVASLLQAAFRFSGDIELYHEALDACRRVADQVAHPHEAVPARALMGSVHLLRGTYHATLDLCDAALALAESAGIAAAPAVAMAHQFRGYVLFEWNRLDEARAALDRAWALSDPEGRGVRSGVARMRAQVAAACGEADEAERWLGRLEEIVAEPMTLRNREWLTAVQIRHTLGRGDLRAMEGWLRTYDYRAHALASLSDAEILARLHELDHVLTMLELTGQWGAVHEIAPLVRRAAAGRRAWFEARAAATDAVALEGLGRRDEAARIWGEAMAVGDVGSFVRLYIEGSPTRSALVERMAARPDADARALALAEALRAEAGAVGTADPGSTLTPKQVEVLRLVGEGLSNKAIAQRLGVSLSTVKTHLHQAFRRLGASSRTGALAEARRRGMLEP